jgi:hypothetical protein
MPFSILMEGDKGKEGGKAEKMDKGREGVKREGGREREREGERRKDKSREGSLPCGESLKPLARHCLVWDATGAAGSFRDSSVVSFVISEAFQFYRKKLLSFLSDVCSFLFLSLLSPHCEFSIHSQ